MIRLGMGREELGGETKVLGTKQQHSVEKSFTKKQAMPESLEGFIKQS